jgi:MtrB/PioB family decaheme-associated outer membrane protein
MRLRARLLLTCAGGSLSIAAVASQAIAADAAPPPRDAAVAWWYHGYIEAGGRFFLNNPPRNGSISNHQDSLAKYYEYSTIKPGPFLYGHWATGSSDGLYQIDTWASNAGYSDQNYQAYLSKAGQHYLTFEWDQTPHVYSTSAQTLYNGVGTNTLVLPAGLSNRLFTDSGNTNPINPANAAVVRQDIQRSTHLTDIGIRRDTASVEYRYTPNSAWDIRLNYSDLHRTGTQVDGVVMSPGTTGVRADVPKPVADTTQNFGVNGEYEGTSLWGQTYTFKLAYGGSIYRDDFNSYTVENPFCPTGAVANSCSRPGSTSSPISRVSLAPDNNANTFTATLGANLPAESRYMGTVSYTMMRQNEAFLPFTITPFSATGGVPPGWTGGTIPTNSTASLPAASLNGAINTFLSNNVVTTQITPELKSKLSYRYYDFANNTPEILFRDWVLVDTASAKATNPSYAPVSSLSISYIKQNAGADLNWRPNREWNLGAGYGYERYSWERTDVHATNENSAKVFADWKPVVWLTARSSWLFSQRRYDVYDYLDFVGAIQWLTPGGGAAPTRVSTAYRQFYLDNRDRNRGQFFVDIDVFDGVTVTPTLGLRNDDFKINNLTEEGMKQDHSLDAGVEASYLMGPDTRFLFSYMHEHHSQIIKSAGNTFPFTPATLYEANVTDRVNTFIASVDHALIPDQLNMQLRYTLSNAVDSQPLVFGNGTIPASGQYPNVSTRFQRFEAIAKYKFDEELVRRLGWTGEVSAKLRYAWERNSVQNWQLDQMNTYMYSSALTTAGYMTWMAWDNPNYDVHLLGASLTWKW